MAYAICCCSNNVVVMKTMSYALWPSLISMSATVSKFEEKQYVVVIETCCDGNDVIHIFISMRSTFSNEERKHS